MTEPERDPVAEAGDLAAPRALDYQTPPAPAEPTRTKRAAWNFASQLLLAVVTMTVGLIATPILIRLLGNTRFGAVRTATEVIGYTSILVLAIDGAVQAVLAQAIGRGDASEIRASLKASLRSYRLVAALMIVAGLGISLFITRLVPVPPAFRWELKVGFAILIADLALTPLTVYQTFIEAGQRSYVILVLLAVQGVITTALCVLAAWLGLGIPGQLASLSLARIPILLTFRRKVRRGLKQAQDPDLRAKEAQVGKRLWKLSRPTFGLGICYRLGLLTDNTLIALFWGPAAVVPFFATQRLLSIAQAQLQGFTTATWAAFSHLDARGDAHRIEQVLGELTRVVIVIGIAGVFPVMVYNQKFVSLWVGSSLFGGWRLTAVAAGVAIGLPITNLWSRVLAGSGRLEPLLPVSIVSTTLNVIVSVVATWRLGLAGPLIGTLSATVLVNSWWLPVLLRRHFAVSPSVLFFAAVEPLLLLLPFVAVWMFVAHTHGPRGWPGLAVHVAAAGLSYLVAAWFLVFRPADRAQFLSRLRMIR